MKRINTLDNRKAYVVEVEEISRRTIIVYDDAGTDFDSIAAEETTEELCNEGTVNLDAEDFQARNCSYLRPATEKDIRLYEAYDQQQESTVSYKRCDFTLPFPFV